MQPTLERVSVRFFIFFIAFYDQRVQFWVKLILGNKRVFNLEKYKISKRPSQSILDDY